MTIDPALLAHVDPDVASILVALDARIAAIPGGAPPFDPSALQLQIDNLAAAVALAAKSGATLEAKLNETIAVVNGHTGQIAAIDGRVKVLEGTPVPIPAPNRAPVWTTVPNVTFIVGVAASFSLAPFVSDADTGDVVSLSLLLGTLSPGITFDAPNKRLVYDGVGPVTTGTTIVINADDGKGP